MIYFALFFLGSITASLWRSSQHTGVVLCNRCRLLISGNENIIPGWMLLTNYRFSKVIVDNNIPPPDLLIHCGLATSKWYIVSLYVVASSMEKWCSDNLGSSKRPLNQKWCLHFNWFISSYPMQRNTPGKYDYTNNRQVYCTLQTDLCREGEVCCT